MNRQTAGQMIDSVAPAGQHEQAGATAATEMSAQHSALKREETTSGTKTKTHGHMPPTSGEWRRDLYRL